MADLVVVAKVDAAAAADVQQVIDSVRAVNPDAPIVRAASPVRLDDVAAVKGRRVLVVEDGPSLTHGGMAYGAGYVAALRAPAGEIVDPRPWAAPEIAAVYAAYPHIGPVLPAVGYGKQQLEALARTLAETPADVIVASTPIDLAASVQVEKPVVRARYEFAEMGEPSLAQHVERFLARRMDG
jgi:predicted GTPase